MDYTPTVTTLPNGMTREFYSGGWYGHAWPTGERSILIPMRGVYTHHLGVVPLPEGEVIGPLYTRCTPVPVFQMAGQAHADQFHNGTWWWQDSTRRWELREPSHGTSGFIFDLLGQLITIPPMANQTSGGFRYVEADGSPTGHLVLGDDTHGSRIGLADWSPLGDGWTVGQAQADAAHDAACVVGPDGVLRRLEVGPCTFIRRERVGQELAITYVVPGGTVVLTGTMDMLAATPPFVVDYLPGPIGRPLWVGSFVFGMAHGPFGNCDLVVSDPMIVRALGGTPIAVYVAAEEDGTPAGLQAAVRVAQAKYPTLPTLPYWTSGGQRSGPPPDSYYVGVEAYRHVGETVEAFTQRIRYSVRACARPWLIAQMYTSNTDNDADLRPIPYVCAMLAREEKNIRGILAFASGTRPTGWEDHPEVHEGWDLLAAGVAGVPPIEIIVAPRPPDPPKPPTPPTPPVLTDPFVSAIPFEVTMKNMTVALIGPGGNYLGVDPGRPGRLLMTATTAGEWEQVELTKPDDRFQLRFIASNLILGADATKYGTDVCKQFYLMPVEARGNYESWDIVRLPKTQGLPEGLLLAFISYIQQGSEGGRHFTSAGLRIQVLG